MQEVVTLNDEQKDLLNKFIDKVVAINKEINDHKEDIKLLNGDIKDSILNLTQKTGIDKKVLNVLAKKIAEPEKVEEQKELLEVVETLIKSLKR